jgi:hypothetical protein
VVNPEKTEIVAMGQRIRFELDNVVMESASKMKVLGLVLDERMTWEEQGKNCIAKCQQMKPALWRLKTK